MNENQFDPPPEKSGLTVVIAVCLAALILPLSFSGGAVATPAIARELGGSAASLTWITNAFMLTFGSLLMTAGALADQYGRKRIFIGGVAVFAVCSLALSFAASLGMIDLLRGMQGVGAAAALAGGSAAMAQEFDGRARTRAFSMLGTTFGVGLAFGPIVAGLLIEYLGWRSIFLTSAVIGALAIVFGAPRMRETRDPDAAGLDWPGILSFTGALSLFTVSVIQAPATGWTDPLVLGLLAGATLLLATFIYAETHTERPMLDLSLFRFPRFVGVQLLPVATCFAYVVLLILLPLRFIGIEGKSEIEAGLLMISLSAPMLIVPSIAVSLTRRLSAGVVAAAGLLFAAAGLLWLGHVSPEDGLVVVAPMLIIGVGAGLPWGLMDGLAVSVVPKERAGMATGIFNTTRVASEGVALAIVSAALSGLASLNIARLLQTNELPFQPLREASQRLATGDLAQASSLLPEVVRPYLVQTYLSSFEDLTWALAAITAASALACFQLLGRRSSPEPTWQNEAPSDLAPKSVSGN